MKNPRGNARNLAAVAATALLGLVASGCATYDPAGGDRGVYYEARTYGASRAAYLDPFVYPYWSLDYFYYSRYYHPFSVVVHRHDPWYYPYPGWYYGYRPGPRFIGHRGRFHYPWYRYGAPYAGFRPWRTETRLSFGGHRHDGHDNRQRVRELDLRLRQLETRQSLAVRSQRPERPRLLPGAAPRLPATSRGSAERRSEPGTLTRDGRGNSDGRRAIERQALIERLRSVDRDARRPEQTERRDPNRSRRPVTAPPVRETRPRRRVDIEPTLPSRQGTVNTPTPPLSQPRRQPVQEPDRPRRSPPKPRRNEADRRERR